MSVDGTNEFQPFSTIKLVQKCYYMAHVFNLHFFPLTHWKVVTSICINESIFETSGRHFNKLVQERRNSINISHTLAGNKIVDHSDVVGASSVGAAPTISSFLT